MSRFTNELLIWSVLVLSFTCAEANRMRWAQEVQWWIRSVLLSFYLWDPGKHPVMLRPAFTLVELKVFLKTAENGWEICISFENTWRKFNVSERIKNYSLPEIPDEMRELQRKCVFCCSEHSSTDRQIINGMKSRLDNMCPHHYVKMCLGRVDHRAYMVFLFQNRRIEGGWITNISQFLFSKDSRPSGGVLSWKPKRVLRSGHVNRLKLKMDVCTASNSW